MNECKFLIKIDDTMYGYDTPALLLIHIKQNDIGAPEIFELKKSLVIKYEKITLEHLREHVRNN